MSLSMMRTPRTALLPPSSIADDYTGNPIVPMLVECKPMAARFYTANFAPVVPVAPLR